MAPQKEHLFCGSGCGRFSFVSRWSTMMASIPLAMLTLPWSTMCVRDEQFESEAPARNIMQSKETREGDCKSIVTRARPVVDEELYSMLVRAAEHQNVLQASNYIVPVDGMPEGRRWNKPESLPKAAIGVWAWPFVLPVNGVPEVWAYQMPAPDDTHITVGAPNGANGAGDFRIFYRVRQVERSKYIVESEKGYLYYTLLRTRKGRWTVTDGENECSQCKRGFMSHYKAEQKDFIKDTYMCLHSNATGELPDNAFQRDAMNARANERGYFSKRLFWGLSLQWMGMSHWGESKQYRTTYNDADPSPYIALGLARMLCKQHAPTGLFNNIGTVCQ